jgi:hypothetical protein
VNTQAQDDRNCVRSLLKEKQPCFAAVLGSAARESALNAKYPDGAPAAGAQQRSAMACAIKRDMRARVPGDRRHSCSHDTLTDLSSL